MAQMTDLRLVLLALAAALVLAGCEQKGTLNVSRPVTPEPLPPGPTRVAGVCLDTTGSTNGALTPLAKTLLQKNLTEFAGQPHGAMHFYLRTLTRDSWSPKNVVLTASIRPVSPERPEPVKKPFESYAKYQQDLDAWRREHEVVVAQQQAARADAEALLAKVAAMKLPIDRGGSDIGGCFAKFGDLEPDQSGPRSLVVLSDLERAGYQTSVPLRLANTKVTVVFWCGETRRHSGAKCEAEKQHWTRELLGGGATSVHFHDASSVPFITDVFN